MSFNIIATPKFKRELKRLTKKFQSLKNEYAELILELENNPVYGTPLGNNCYKIRLSIASKNKGKSGGARVITYVVVKDTTVFLMYIYDKSEQSDISDSDLLQMIKEVE